MVKIRLRRIGTKGRPFYRVVVAKSTAARNGTFVETIGTYDPVAKPTKIEVNQERALHWLRTGAQPTETTAYILNKIGVLDQYFTERPNARKQFGFLDKRTAATSVASVVDQNVATSKKAAASTPAEAPVAQAAAAEEPAPAENAAPVEETPAAEPSAPTETPPIDSAAPAEEPAAEEPAAEASE